MRAICGMELFIDLQLLSMTATDFDSFIADQVAVIKEFRQLSVCESLRSCPVVKLMFLVCCY